MNITITFDSLEELKAFQRGVRVLDDSTPEAPAEKRQEPAEAPAKEETHKSTPNTEKRLTEADFTPGGGGVEGNIETENTAPAQPDPTPAPVDAPAMNPPEEPKKEAPAQIDPAQLKVFASDMAKKGFRAQLKDLLNNTYKERSVTDLLKHQPDKAMEFYEKLKGVCDAV